jgi:hypothetical protein
MHKIEIRDGVTNFGDMTLSFRHLTKSVAWQDLSTKDILVKLSFQLANDSDMIEEKLYDYLSETPASLVKKLEPGNMADFLEKQDPGAMCIASKNKILIEEKLIDFNKHYKGKRIRTVKKESDHWLVKLIPDYNEMSIHDLKIHLEKKTKKKFTKEVINRLRNEGKYFLFSAKEKTLMNFSFKMKENNNLIEFSVESLCNSGYQDLDGRKINKDTFSRKKGRDVCFEKAITMEYLYANCTECKTEFSFLKTNDADTMDVPCIKCSKVEKRSTKNATRVFKKSLTPLFRYSYALMFDKEGKFYPKEMFEEAFKKGILTPQLIRSPMEDKFMSAFKKENPDFLEKSLDVKTP